MIEHSERPRERQGAQVKGLRLVLLPGQAMLLGQEKACLLVLVFHRRLRSQEPCKPPCEM